MGQRTIRTVTGSLARDGLLKTKGKQSPFTIGLTVEAMAGYFLDRGTPSITGLPANSMYAAQTNSQPLAGHQAILSTFHAGAR